MLCYYFPPLGMGGAQRPAKFAKYLPHHGWRPTVLTVRPVSYWARDDTLAEELADIDIVRTESLDPQRLLARLGSVRAPRTGAAQLNRGVLSWFLQPDSKILWWPHAVSTVNALAADRCYDALYTTSPPHSVHLLGKHLAAGTGLPWLADFRDRWAGGVVVHEPTRLHRRFNRFLQRRVANAADRIICTTPSLQRDLRDAGGRPVDLIPNGFDPGDYPVPSRERLHPDRFVFCHCGSITRFSSPEPLLSALVRLRERDAALLQRMVFHFVGEDTTRQFGDLVRAAGLGECVLHLGYRPHRSALQFLVDADALILIARGRPGDGFVPGKSYEYIGARKPILLLSQVNDTVDLLRSHPQVWCQDPDDIEGIASALLTMLRQPGRKSLSMNNTTARFDRRVQTGHLAQILDEITKQPKEAD